MRAFWSWASQRPGVRAVDLTPHGHWSGTGALVFDASTVDLVVEVVPDPENNAARV